MKYTDQQRLQKIYDNAKKLCEYIRNHDVKREDLLSDYSLQWLVTTPLYNIGEHVYYLSDAFKTENNEVEWAMIAGLDTDWFMAMMVRTGT